MGADADEVGQEPTMVSPTALAETAVAGVTSDLTAWSNSDDICEPAPYGRANLRNWLISGATFLCAVGAVGGALLFTHAHRSAEPKHSSSPSSSTSSMPVSAKPILQPEQLLNGRYEILHDWARATYRGNERKGGGRVRWDTSEMSDKTWAIFATTCTETDCIATVTGYNPDGSLATGHGVMRFENGTWIDLTPTRTQQECVNSKSGVVEGMAWWTSRWSFTPRPDGTLRGEHVTSVDSDECGDKGDTQVVPITLARIGEVDASVVPRPTTDYDQVMLDALRAKGWQIPDGLPAAAAARRICRMLIDGKTPEQAAQIYAQQNGNPIDASRIFVQVVTQTYPNCP